MSQLLVDPVLTCLFAFPYLLLVLVRELKKMVSVESFNEETIFKCLCISYLIISNKFCTLMFKKQNQSWMHYLQGRRKPKGQWTNWSNQIALVRNKHAHLWFPPLFLAVNHHNIENWVPSILTHNLWLIFMGMKQKSFFFLRKKNLKWPTQKKVIFQLCQFSIFLWKFSESKF